jgi:hypothetical protein
VDFTSPFVVSALLGPWSFTGKSCHDADVSRPSGSQERLSAHAPPRTYAKDPKDNAMFEPDEKHSLGYENIWDKCGVQQPQRPSSQPMQQASIMDLPVGVRLCILKPCTPIPSKRIASNSINTFPTLLRVSKSIQNEFHKACLPHIPLALWTKKIYDRFATFCANMSN